MTFDQIEMEIDRLGDAAGDDPAAVADALLCLGEQTLEKWVAAHGQEPTPDKREGFRILALHRQGAKGVPSFNACRETCRELVYHRNLIVSEPDHPDTSSRVKMMAMVARHLCLFVCGKMQTSELGEFCCSSRPLRANSS